jgi:hypothetical protein
MIEFEYARSAVQLVPRRLALLRLEVLDLSSTISRAVIGDLALAHDFSLQGGAGAASQEITVAERQLLAAQGQVMRELAILGGGPTWEEMEIA